MDNWYDAAGNTTHDATTNLNYSYDAENRITGAGGYAYTYDADGNRVEKSNGSTGTIYWYMSPGIVGESDLSGNLQSEYVFFDGERIARRDNPSSSGPVSYYFSDHLKTASVITNSAGITTEDEDYYPWGGELQFVNNDSNHYKFTGKERDAETGLDYFGARYYGNWLGRWMSPDWAATPVPIPYADLTDPQTLNQYGYVRNIPTVTADFDGHGWLSDTWDFLRGVANAYGSDNAAGVGRNDEGSAAYHAGQTLGDGAALVGGAIETTEGTGGEVISTAADGTGVGAIVGVPGNVASGFLIVHGTVTVGVAGGHLMSDKGTGSTGTDSKPYEPTQENLDKMKDGKAPTGKDGQPVELHHDGQQPNGTLKEMTRTDHRGGSNFKKNHTNTGQRKSQVNRSQFNKQRRRYWKQQYQHQTDKK